MSKQIKVVVGANFGDEGKGLMTDYFCHELSKDGSVLNIRHNGGAQAGHTVVTPDGKRHVFSHFGAGSFVPHVATYLSRDFILNPILFCRELDHLKSEFGIEPKVYIHKDCRITTPYDMLINQVVERFRGSDRHGSCGVGINETVERYNNHVAGIARNVNMVASKILSINLCDALTEIRTKYVPFRLSELGVTEISDNDRMLFNSINVVSNWISQLMRMLDYCILTDDVVLQRYDHLVFEGAQGLLLDQDNDDLAPHLTTSKTGSVNPKNMLLAAGLEECDIEVCYVTRSYFTRHGAGFFRTECNKSDILPDDVEDKTNHTNEFQGALRYGYFDTRWFKRAVSSDMEYRRNLFPYLNCSIAVTHCDETDGYIPMLWGEKYACYSLSDYGYLSCGETRDDITQYSKNTQETCEKINRF